MIEIAIDRNQIEEMAREAIREKLKAIDQEVYFMDSKQVLKYVNMSWNSFNTHILNDPNFHAAIRLGNKWLFDKKELDQYLADFFIAVRDVGGDIQKYTKR
ncbi:group-specific protein [Sporosarcina obsidiansis]|uniref:group-specific protein n=1 Tax=Sporosarcina obsidiansis TaxID=2660748 RepID=UPI00129B23BB|nr:group-specific protein [Sporosarcina obsidiansis]